MKTLQRRGQRQPHIININNSWLSTNSDVNTRHGLTSCDATGVSMNVTEWNKICYNLFIWYWAHLFNCEMWCISRVYI